MKGARFFFSAVSLLFALAIPKDEWGMPGDQDLHDPKIWQDIAELSHSREVFGNIQIVQKDRTDTGIIGENAARGIFLFEDELVWNEFLPAAQMVQSILERSDIEAFVRLSSERFLDLLHKRMATQLGKKTPPRKGIRESWRSMLHASKDPEGMHRLFSIRNEWRNDSWWQVTCDPPIEYKGKYVPVFSVAVYFSKEHKGPFRHVAFTFVKEDGHYRLADYDADWEDIGGPFQAREYGY